MSKVPIVLCIMGVLLVSCSTISERAAQQQAKGLLQLVEDGQVEEALALSSRPFLFEGEILVSQGLVSQLWTGLAGIQLGEAQLDSMVLVDQDSYKYFRDSWEVKTWFENYTDPQTLLVFYNWQDRELVLVVDRRRSAPQPILGFGEVAP